MRRLAFLLSLLTLLSLTGCHQEPASPSRSQGIPSSSSAHSTPEDAPSQGSATQGEEKRPTTPQSPSPDPSSTFSSSVPQKAPSPTLAYGTYKPTENVGVDLSLEIREEGTYLLGAKVFLLSGEVSGNYTLEGETLTLQAQKVSLPVYSGENVGSLDLKLQEDGSLYYLCDDFIKQFGITAQSITFVKEAQ